MSILLGFEIPTGRRVEIPETGHMAGIGQTQLSGKTTTFEAIVARAGTKFKAVAFITKPGESSFLTGHMIPPYFSEPTADAEQPLWQWVVSILEASQSRKMRFEESWIIRACEDPRKAKTLADVHQNILDLLRGEKIQTSGRRPSQKIKHSWLRKPVTGIHAGVYTSLKAYFDIVMPQLARLPYTKKLTLRPGLNVMDLRDYSLELQSLVIRSVMEHVYTREKNTRVIVPEAQDFVPRGKNSPVKMACENLVRKGGADYNFMWLDSQDIVAVDYTMLRAVSILFCGVQGQMHEINRAIEHMFGSGLKPEDIGRLNIGEFYLRLPGASVTKVYVQPAWMDSEVHAQAIARGEVPVSTARTMLNAFIVEKGAQKEAEREEEATASLESTASADGIHSPPNSDSENPGDAQPIADCDRADKEDAVWKEKYEELTNTCNTLRASNDGLHQECNALARQVNELKNKLAAIVDSERVPAPDKAGAVPPREAHPTPALHFGNGDIKAGGVSLEQVYHYVRDRAVKDPFMLNVLATRPELRVNLALERVEVKSGTLKGNVAMLIAEKFFDSPRDSGTIRRELGRRGMLPNGPKTPNSLLATAVGDLHKMGFLTEESDGYLAVSSMKVNIVGA